MSNPLSNRAASLSNCVALLHYSVALPNPKRTESAEYSADGSKLRPWSFGADGSREVAVVAAVVVALGVAVVGWCGVQ
jgi:hypothetical protein